MSLLSEVLILFLLNEMRSLPNVPNAENVSTVCAFTSFAPIRSDVNNGNLIGLRLSEPSLKVSQRIQLSMGHWALADIFFLSLLKESVISFPIFFLRTLPILQISTGSLLIAKIVSHDMSPICCPRKSAETLSIVAGVEIRFPLINHCACKNSTVGIR